MLALAGFSGVPLLDCTVPGISTDCGEVAFDRNFAMSIGGTVDAGLVVVVAGGIGIGTPR